MLYKISIITENFYLITKKIQFPLQYKCCDYICNLIRLEKNIYKQD